ncbi:PC-Esterase [Corchorus olitorius]|uniref:PC-Esterase n=1 Tax=Corchorus olitorius TaxID=93759 RepID=A0A1R3GS38_9ROSI|nr:PC-Esterase [Corchorus olitorius]
MDPLVAYEKGLNTWAKWVDDNIDPSKTTVFFQGTSPDHWNINNEDGNTCAGVTQPASKASPSETIVAGQKIVEKVLGKMTNPVYFLNITNLSQLRPDGHPSKYGPLPNQNDCIYWCLSGVADTWNQLLYAFLLQLSN